MREHVATFDHTGDLGLEIVAATPARLFALAAEALCAQIALPAPGAAPLSSRLVLEGDDGRDLFVHWLNSVLLETELRHAIWTRVEVTALTARTIEATLLGQKLELGRQVRLREVKAISHHALELELAAPACRAKFVLDL